MRKLAVATLIALSTSAAPSLVAQAMPPAATLDSLAEIVRQRRERNNIPGIALAVASRGTLLHVITQGMADVEQSVPVSDSTVFEIGSVSKQFVAVATLQMMEEGRLSLEDPVHRHLPWLPGEWRGVTIRHLLNHTSGIPDYEAIQGYEAYRNRFTPEQIIAVALSRSMDFAPGTGWQYTNTGYFILSLVLESVDEAPLDALLQRRIFGPVGMTSTRMGDPARIIPNRAQGYYQDRNQVLINTDPSEPTSTLGAGGLVSTLGDLVRWDAALYGTDLLSDASKRLMWTPTTLPDGRTITYGFGWRVEPYQGHLQQYHYGQMYGFIANITRLPDDELVVIALANRYREDLGRVVVPAMQAFLEARGDD